MSLIHCLIIDDEPPALKILQKYIDSVSQLKLVGKCENAFQAMGYLQNYQIDLLFLDIKMPKLTGTAFVKTLKHPPKVIFTTAYSEYAVEAFELDVVDYLLKPFSFERFMKAVNKVIFREQGDRDLSEDSSIQNSPEFIYLRADRKMIKIFLDDIIYAESLKDYIRIHRTGNTPLIVKQTISNFEEMLPDHLFIRIHRSFIVSLFKITAYTQHDVEIGDIEIPIGRVYSHNFSRASIKNNGRFGH